MVSIILLLLINSCGGLFLENRFAKSRDWLYFGKYSGDFDKECRKQDGIKPYNNGVQPSRTCGSYQRYLCRINITCKKYQDLEERRRCEWDARNYWINSRILDAKTREVLEPIQATKEICEAQKAKCNSSPKNDKSCLR